MKEIAFGSKQVFVKMDINIDQCDSSKSYDRKGVKKEKKQSQGQSLLRVKYVST